MNVVVDGELEIVTTNSRIGVTISDNRETVVVNENRYDVVEKGGYVPYDLQAHISALEAEIARLYGLYNGLLLDVTNNENSNDTVIAMMNSIIVEMGGEIDTIQMDTSIADGLAILDDYVRTELLTKTGSVSYITSQESYNAALTFKLDAAVAEVQDNVAATYETKTAVASISNGITDLRAEASTFTYVTTTDGKKAISGWKSVADTASPSAFYIYADTFKVIGTQNGEIVPLEPISYIGEFSTHPLPMNSSQNSVYKNSIDGNTYILKGIAWELFVSKGASGSERFTSYVFTRSATIPLVPTGGTYAEPIPLGWFDIPPDGTDTLYMSTAVFVNGAATVVWSTPVQVNGRDGIALISEYSVDGITWHSAPFVAGDIFMHISDDAGVTWGSSIRIVGERGQGQVKGICFLRSATTPATPSGGSYADATATGWSDGIPTGTLPLYMTTRTFTSDGLSPQDAVWTTPQLSSSLGQGTKVQFSVNGSTLWHDTPATSDVYMRTGTSTDGGATWTYAGAVKIKGEVGATGATGIQGIAGANGVTTYTWVKYASDANGTGITDFPAGMTYLGMAYNKTTATESTNPADYTWSLIRGTDGIAGTNGVDGITTYTWIKYADTAAGAGMSDIATGKLYIGIAVNKTTATESTTATDYTWALIKGETGATGIQGIAGANGVTTYTWVKYASDANGTGITDFPAGMTYLGMAYNKTTATESTNPADYTWSLIRGTDGIAGTNGVDGITTYTWIKYADTIAGAGMSDIATGKTYIGIAVNKTTATESTTATDYTWALIKGADGAAGAAGARGAGVYKAVTTSAAWSDTEANAIFTNLGITKVLLDSVTLYNNTSATKWTKTKRWSGTSWIDEGTVLDGNLIVDGSILGNKINANSAFVSTLMINDNAVTVAASYRQSATSQLAVNQSDTLIASLNVALSGLQPVTVTASYDLPNATVTTQALYNAATTNKCPLMSGADNPYWFCNTTETEFGAFMTLTNNTTGQVFTTPILTSKSLPTAGTGSGACIFRFDASVGLQPTAGIYTLRFYASARPWYGGAGGCGIRGFGMIITEVKK